jgi:hypothetical protein
VYAGFGTTNFFLSESSTSRVLLGGWSVPTTRLTTSALWKAGKIRAFQSRKLPLVRGCDGGDPRVAASKTVDEEDDDDIETTLGFVSIGIGMCIGAVAALRAAATVLY